MCVWSVTLRTRVRMGLRMRQGPHVLEANMTNVGRLDLQRQTIASHREKGVSTGGASDTRSTPSRMTGSVSGTWEGYASVQHVWPVCSSGSLRVCGVVRHALLECVFALEVQGLGGGGGGGRSHHCRRLDAHTIGTHTPRQRESRPTSRVSGQAPEGADHRPSEKKVILYRHCSTCPSLLLYLCSIAGT